MTPIRLENPAEAHTLEFNLTYDPSVLEVVEVQPGSRLAVSASSYDTDTQGVVRFDLTVSDQLYGDGSAAVVAFKVVGAAGASSPLTITEAVAADSSSNALSIELTEGAFTVETPSAGDGNGDGNITALDALIALRMSAGIAKVDLLMDVNGDGRVTPNGRSPTLVNGQSGIGGSDENVDRYWPACTASELEMAVSPPSGGSPGGRGLHRPRNFTGRLGS